MPTKDETDKAFDSAAERSAVWEVFRRFVDGMVEPLCREEGLATIADTVLGIGMGEQGVYFNKDEYLGILGAITKETSGVEYTLEYGRHEIALYPPGAATVLSELTVRTDAHSGVSRTVQMATLARVDGGRWLVTSASCAPLSMSPGSIYALPLKFAENTLAQLKHELQAEAVELLNTSIPGGLISFQDDPDYSISFINAHMLDYLGYSQIEFDARFGRKFLNLVHPEDRGMLRGAIDVSLSKGNEYEIRHRVLRKDRETAWVIQRGRRTKEDAELLLSVFTDVTEIINLQHDLVVQKEELAQSLEARKRQERHLQEAVDAAREASRAKTTFLATMSHEIRTPMNGVIGFAELALDDATLSPRSRDYIQKIKQSAVGLFGVINDILDISKIESGRMETERIAFRLAAVIRQCESLILERATEKGVRLVVEQDLGGNPEMLGDPTKLRQILVNLLSNAVKFTKKGTVTLRVRVNELADGGYSAYFEVVDTGIGMTPEEVKRIFLPFVQADSSTTRQYGGTGLGLTISKSYIEMLGGELKAASCPGAGSRFSFVLGFDHPEHDSPGFAGGGGAKSFRDGRPVFSARVLVCEDNDMNREVIREHLSGCGIDPEMAVNGRVGVEMVRERMGRGEPYDLIFMDIYMPEVDGLDAMRQLRLAGSAAPVVAMTANVMKQDQVLYREHGMSDCLGKPFVAKELWSCLLKFLKPVKWIPNHRRPLSGLGDSGREERRQALNKTVALPLLDRLEVLLRSGDIQILDNMESIRETFAPLGGDCGVLLRQIESYDFEDALQTLKEMRSKMGMFE